MTTATRQTVGFGSLLLPAMTVSVLTQIVTGPFQRVSSLVKGNKVSGTYREFLAGSTHHYGKFFQQDLTHPDGTIILTTSNWKRSGSPLREASVAFRIREGGALWQMSAALPESSDHNLGSSFPVLRARGDILRQEDLGQYGIEVPDYFARRYMDLEEIEECFTFDTLSPQRTARPNTLIIALPEGGTKRIDVAAAPIRRLRRPVAG